MQRHLKNPKLCSLGASRQPVGISQTRVRYANHTPTNSYPLLSSLLFSPAESQKIPVSSEATSLVHTFTTRFRSKSICQRCLNHDLQIPRKGHKQTCTYNDCICEKSVLVARKRLYHRKFGHRLSKTKSLAQQKEARNSTCVMCSVHGREEEALKGHTQRNCPIIMQQIYVGEPFSRDKPHFYPCELVSRSAVREASVK